jgi:hypothetical protein
MLIGRRGFYACYHLGYEIINEAVFDMTKRYEDELSTLRWKIAFYERHFGKLKTLKRNCLKV